MKNRTRKFNKKHNNQIFNDGFTLIELIVVIAIIGILAAILIPSYLGFVDKSNAGVCNSNKATLERLYADSIADGQPPINLVNQTLEAYLNSLNMIPSDYSVCPSDGIITWSLSTDGSTIKGTCSIASHNISNLGIVELIYTADKWFRLQGGQPYMINSYLTGGGVNVVIPPTISGTAITTIGLNAFNGKSLESVIIPEGITTISSGSFGNNNFTKIAIPKNITIAGNVFIYTPLTEVTIGSNVILTSSSFRTTAASFPSTGWDYGFKTLYDSPSGGAGTYVFNETTKKWVKQ